MPVQLVSAVFITKGWYGNITIQGVDQKVSVAYGGGCYSKNITKLLFFTVVNYVIMKKWIQIRQQSVNPLKAGVEDR